jgi:hypothetical protein
MPTADDNEAVFKERIFLDKSNPNTAAPTTPHLQNRNAGARAACTFASTESFYAAADGRSAEGIVRFAGTSASP